MNWLFPIAVGLYLPLGIFVGEIDYYLLGVSCAFGLLNTKRTPVMLFFLLLFPFLFCVTCIIIFNHSYFLIFFCEMLLVMVSVSWNQIRVII